MENNIKYFKTKTNKGIYYDAISKKGKLGTNRNGRKWFEMRNNISMMEIQIKFAELPTYLQTDLENYNL